MNSILQCIFATAPLTQFFLDKGGYSSEKKLRSWKLSESYCDLLKKGRKNKGSSITPSDLKS
jgi:ubiquitin C-terminal hydrolase